MEDAEVTVATKSNRRRFVRMLGVTLLTAVGAGALASGAFAAGPCCWNAGCPDCATQQGHQCWCPCPTGGYCWSESCFLNTTGGCSSCPC